MTDFIGEDDLLALVDDQLDPDRREAVERGILAEPTLAWRVAADLAILAGLRRLFGTEAEDGPYTSFLA